MLLSVQPVLGLTSFIFNISSLDAQETESGEVRRIVVQDFPSCNHETGAWMSLRHRVAPGKALDV